MSTFSLATYASNQNVEEGLTCSSKQQAIETQIQYAKKNNETSRVQGLEKALHQVTTFCTNDKLEARYKLDIHEKTMKVAERQKELAEAQAKGNQQKIAKQDLKLRDAEKELSDAQAKLVAFHEEIAAK
ncbi:hypothetical protein A9G11_06375 [Gilliamella sp. wkB108]|nr:hypothetical protein A9G11_06375 [Gilliamella apicola]